MSPLPRVTARRVRSALRRGSSAPVVVDTDRGTFVVKLRGAASGLPALVAEVIVAELATALDLAVPDRVIVELDDGVPSDDRNDELADLLAASHGANLGFRFLPDATDLRARDAPSLDRAWAERVLWLDGLVMNPDRTEANPNVLLWHGAPWLIDHGAALPFHHHWPSLTEQAPREPGVLLGQHLLWRDGTSLESVDADAARRVTRRVLEDVAQTVPRELLPPDEDATRLRAAYAAFLWKRLAAPRPFMPAK